MSLLFSEIIFHRKDSYDTSLMESGHPDEHDVRELLKYEDRYAFVRDSDLKGVTVQVQQYRFLGGGAKDWLAEREHLALMEAYNEASPHEVFTERDDVEHLDYFEFKL